jgi:hypothetical protein
VLASRSEFNSVDAPIDSSNFPSLEDPAPLVRANEAVLTYMHSHAIARTSGSPFDCAADAMSLDMPEYCWFTSPDPKRRVSGAATYVHTHGWQGIFSDHSIVITQRQVGSAIDGILGQELSKIARVFTDTHGFSAMAGAFPGMSASSCVRGSRTTTIGACTCRAEF